MIKQTLKYLKSDICGFLDLSLTPPTCTDSDFHQVHVFKFDFPSVQA